MTDSGSEPPSADADADAIAAADLAAAVSETDKPAERRRLTAAFARARSGRRAAGHGARAAGRGMRVGSGFLAGQVAAMAPRLRIRDQAALRSQFPGRSADAIADELIARAGRAAAAVGGTVGAWAALPIPPAVPAEITAETLALVGIEVKLIAELHEAYGMPAAGGAAARTAAYVAAWAHRRGVYLLPTGVALAAGSPLMRLLRRRLAARAARSSFSMGPLLTGAAAGALLNRRETLRLGQQVRADLQRRAQGGEVIKPGTG